MANSAAPGTDRPARNAAESADPPQRPTACAASGADEIVAHTRDLSRGPSAVSERQETVCTAGTAGSYACGNRVRPATAAVDEAGTPRLKSWEVQRPMMCPQNLSEEFGIAFSEQPASLLPILRIMWEHHYPTLVFDIRRCLEHEESILQIALYFVAGTYCTLVK